MRKMQVFVRVASIVLGTFLSVDAAPAQNNPPPQPPGARLRGWVDLHTHPLSNLGFGGKLIYGGVDIYALLPADPDCHQNVRAMSIEEALGHDKSTHGGHDFLSNPCGDEIRKLIITQAFHHPREDEVGYPDFTDWPQWDDLTHQKMWVDWIRRAYNSGLRVMVALAVNNKTLADAVAPSPFVLGFKGDGDYATDDKASADLQIEEIKKFVDRHSDFMEVAYSATDVERIVRANKLAVVLGVEIDNIGNLKGNASTAQLIAEIDRLYYEGVSYIFPIHLLDNPFGTTAAYEDLFNFSTYREEGHYWDLRCAPAPKPGNPSSEVVNYHFSADPTHVVLPMLLNLAGPKLQTQFPILPPYRSDCGLTNNPVNNPGLTTPGLVAIEHIMKRGMFIDIDHMSDNSKYMTIALAQGIGRNGAIGYPLNSGHSGLRGFFPPVIVDAQGHTKPPDKMDINERSTSWWQYQQIAKLHGMVGVGSDGLMAYQWANMYWHVLAATGGPAGSGIAGFGTDLNGLAKGMPPDAEQDADIRNPAFTIRGCLKNCGIPRVQYPFAPPPTTRVVSTFPMSSLGTRSFDYNTLGVAHYGMLADFLQDIRNQEDLANRHEAVGSHQPPPRLVEDNLMFGADYFFETWKKCEALKDPGLDQRHLTDRQFTATANPSSVTPGVLTTIVVQVIDNDTRMPVSGAMIHIDSGSISAGQPFRHTFVCHVPQANPRAPRNTTTEPRDFPNPAFVVSAPGFVDGSVEFTISGPQAGKVLCK